MKKNENSNGINHSSKEIDRSISVLENLVKDTEQLVNLPKEQRIALLKVAGELSRPHRAEIRKRNKTVKMSRRLAKREKNRRARETTGIRHARTHAIFSAPKQIALHAGELEHEGEKLSSPRNCYICKEEFSKLHFFYDTLCKKCADLNYSKRFQTASLHGQVALITGARVKIGYQTTLMMLRAGATVLATTRFPVDAALRYSKEADYEEWGDRVQIHGLDLRHTPSVEIFASYVKQTHDRLDILINNAAQTVRRPPGFYAHLLENEKRPYSDLPEKVQKFLGNSEAFKNKLTSFCNNNGTQEKNLALTWQTPQPGMGLRESAQLSQIPYSQDSSISPEEIFPEGKLDADLQQVDLRKTNSWRLRLGEIPTTEMLEVQLVNSVAPFVLCNRLLPLMKRDTTWQYTVLACSGVKVFTYFIKFINFNILAHKHSNTQTLEHTNTRTHKHPNT